MPFRAADDSGSLFCKQVVELVEPVEDEGSRLWVVTKKEGEGLAVQSMAGKAMQDFSPLSTLAGWSPSGNTEDKVVNVAENGFWYMMRTGGLCAQMIGDMLGTCLANLVLVLVNNYG